MTFTSVFRGDAVSRFVASLLVSLFAFAPVPSFAASAATATIAPAPTRFLNVTDSATVGRGVFIRAAMKALGISPDKGKRELKYKNIPSTYQLYIQKAETLGALTIFGDTLDIRKPITRGEALIVLSKFLDQAPKKASFSYSDVRGDDMERAVGLALEQGWMKAESAKSFGVSSVLKGKEGKLLIQRIMRSSATPETITIPLINIKGRSTSLPKEDVLRAVWGLLQDEYLYQDKLDGEKAMSKSIEGLVQSLKDPYTVYLPPASSTSFQNQLKGEVEGIGATVEQTGATIVIVAPIKGSPAEKAGLQPKDQVLSADGVSFTGLTLDEAVSKIRGPKGTTVSLHIRRNGNEFDVQVMRDTVKIPEVEINVQGSTAVVKIYQFGQTTDTQLRGKIADLKNQNIHGMILDLRNNPGGLLHAASSVVGLFVPKGSTYASILGRQSTSTEVTEDDPVVDPSVKLVVLVNEGSASASEIVAGALQDAKRATIVGHKTFGKGTVQQIVNFNDGSSLKMTIAEWRTPTGRKIDGVGVMPDEVVDLTSSRDEQMLRALDLTR